MLGRAVDDLHSTYYRSLPRVTHLAPRQDILLMQSLAIEDARGSRCFQGLLGQRADRLGAAMPGSRRAAR